MAWDAIQTVVLHEGNQGHEVQSLHPEPAGEICPLLQNQSPRSGVSPGICIEDTASLKYMTSILQTAPFHNNEEFYRNVGMHCNLPTPMLTVPLIPVVWAPSALQAAMKEFKRLKRSNDQAPGYAMSRVYLETLADLPWNSFAAAPQRHREGLSPPPASDSGSSNAGEEGLGASAGESGFGTDPPGETSSGSALPPKCGGEIG